MREKFYPETGAEVSFPDLEEKILKFWEDDNTFKKSIYKNTEEEFVFYDGPPFANGLPHYGHLLTGFVKDTIGRYHTMLGKRVERRFGWDCHGLPAEIAVEKELDNIMLRITEWNDQAEWEHSTLLTVGKD